MLHERLNDFEYGAWAFGRSGKRLAARFEELGGTPQFTWVVVENILPPQPCPLPINHRLRTPSVAFFEINHPRDAELVLQHLRPLTARQPLLICAGYLPLKIGRHASNKVVIEAARYIERNSTTALFINRDELWKRSDQDLSMNTAIHNADCYCAAMVLTALHTIAPYQSRPPKPNRD